MKNTVIFISIILSCHLNYGQITLKDSVELEIRDGIPNFMAKAATDKPVHIGYIGGSITSYENGWRSKSLAWFKQFFNNDDISHYNK